MAASTDVRPVDRVPRLLVLACAAIVVTIAVRLYLDSPPAFMDLDVYRKGVAAWWRG
ncbi:MAG TPA: hypothetical protein VFW65_19530 [Pseudonocardiaceae bacterium]|nr:hypothetical protein [Pseudonocardiaceae bacterium]